MKKIFPWLENYFTAKVVLGFSEAEFWRSSPRKIEALKLFYNKTLAAKNAPASAKIQAEEIKALLRL